MKKLFITSAALAAALLVAPNLVSQSEAAVRSSHAAHRAKSPFCDLAKIQKNPVSWNAAYGCLGTSRARARVYTREAQDRSVDRSPFCDLAKVQKNPVSWNEAYGCLTR